MSEVIIPIIIILALTGGGLWAWKLLRGPARRRSGAVARAISLGLVCGALVSASAWKFSKSRTLQLFGGIVPRVETSAPVVALTFDDGPSSQYTEEVLAILREHGVEATFFVNGRAVEENMDATKAIVAEGHELGNHTYSHQHMMLKSYAFTRQEIERTDRLIRQAGYEGDIHFRSPYGKKLIVLPYYLYRTGRLNIFFDVEPESYPEIAADADKIVAHVLETTRPGSIILLHVMPASRAESRQALPAIIQGLQDQGYNFVTISKLLALNKKQ